ncbi:MAG: ATP-dependent DNA helicase [Opitutaceae bacterium]
MQIDPIDRSVHISVRELANFRNIPIESDGYGYSAWRAALGQRWHKTSEENTKASEPEAEFEVTIKAQWKHRDWTFHIQGRIDQILPQDDVLCLREVKTVRTALPQASETLLDRYPDHFAQAAIYVNLARVLPRYANHTLRATLLFIDIENGAVQSVELTDVDERLFTQQLDTLIPFLEDRRECRVRLNGAKIRPAFETLREGQAELFVTLAKACLQSKTVCVEAPTGFGKTGIILEHALTQLKSGVFERCIYLTSKSTGQLETTRQLRAMIGDQVRFIQMRNRNEHRIDSDMHTCTGDSQCNEQLGQRWTEAGIYSPALFTDGTLTIEQARRIGSETGVCPYALTKGCLPFAEIWIGDTNYIFSPASQSVFLEQHNFDAKKTLLIIDEAHNLPDRVADALSVELSATDLLFALEELHAKGAARRLVSIGNELARCIESLTEGPISSNAVYELQDLCDDFTRQLQEAHIDYENCAPFAIELVWRIPELLNRLNEPAHEWLYWTPYLGAFRATCLDASNWIARCLQPFGGSVLMSATISPIESFREHCGLSANDTTSAIGHAPWRNDAYDVAIDCRVDTRYTQRDKYYECTARTIAALIAHSPGVPVAVFFASYKYAENIAAYLNAIDPAARVQIQPRGVDLQAQESFVDEGLLIADALFMILGSSFAEGVDKLGGRIQTVMIVGPALPEVNAVQKAKVDAHPSMNREASFRDVYIVPAMRRIHQALGRIVRAPNHRARVILHGKRYAESAYYDQLAPEYQSDVKIHSDAELHAWLER